MNRARRLRLLVDPVQNLGPAQAKVIAGLEDQVQRLLRRGQDLVLLGASGRGGFSKITTGAFVQWNRHLHAIARRVGEAKFILFFLDGPLPKW